MKGIFSKAILIVFFISTGLSAQTDSIAPQLTDSSLISYLRSNYYPSTPRNYDAARDSMFQYLDVDATDSLTCVYSGLRAKRDGTRTPSNGALSFNTEHSWPQSFYDEAEPMRGDIHHLFPTWSSPNQSRSNHPFAEIDDNNTTSWWYWENGSSVSSIPVSNIDLYSEYYNDTFEPREDHKGNAARAMFYFWTLYATNNDIVTDAFDNEAFFEGMKATLYQWHIDDPVDANEVARSNGIESIQGNKNPFIHDTTLVRRAYFTESSDSSSSDTTTVFISEVYEANGGTVKYIELYNNTASTINFDSENWALLRFSNAGTSPSSISLSGSISSKSFFVIGDDNNSSGVQTVFGENVVDQNSSSINHNGNDKYALVKNATTSPDTVDWFGKDNVGNSSSFASNQVLYRVFERLPNDGSIGQTSNASDGDTTSSGFWRAYDISSSNSNAELIATPGFNKGIESDLKSQAMIKGSAGWRLVSIPGNSANLNQLSDDIAIQGVGDASDANVYLYNNSGSFQAPSSLSNTLSNGEGLAVYFFNNDLEGSTSLPNILDTDLDEPGSDVSVTLNTTNLESGTYFTLVGNPFQKNFDLNSMTSDQTLQSNVHVLDNGLYSPIARSTSIVLPWQGFWVESPSVSPATSVTFPTSGKTDGNATVASFEKRINTSGALQLNLDTSSGTDKGCKIELRDDAVLEWDIHDASKINPTRTDFGILSCMNTSGTKTQSVLSLPSGIDTPVELELAIESQNIEMDASISWEIDEQLHSDFDFILSDQSEDQEVILSEDGNFQFTLNSSSKEVREKGVLGSLSMGVSKYKSDNRFSLLISPKLGTAVDEEISSLEYSLEQNYPNPFNPSTIISYSISKPGVVKLEVFNILGQKVVTLVDEFRASGTYKASFDASNIPGGVYFYRMSANDFSTTKKMLLIK